MTGPLRTSEQNIAKRTRSVLMACLCAALLSSCGHADVPGARKVSVPEAEAPSAKFKAVNRIREAPVVYVKLGEDILRPMRQADTRDLPTKSVGPVELREETLAAALQLVLADTDVPLAFQTSEALARTVTVSQLHGPVHEVVERLCSLADLYCSYEKGVLVIKDVETFNVSLPPLAEDNYDQFLNGIKNVTGRDAYIDNTTRTLIYSSSHRNNQRAQEYFDRLRTNTALIVFETQIWEVTLNNGNDTGVRWESLPIDVGSGMSPNTLTDGNAGFNLGSPGSNIAGGLTSGVRYLSGSMNMNVVFQFLSSQGSVKTISQPQITVLSGSTAKLRVGNSQKYISQITRTAGLNATGDNLSLTTDTLQTGLNMEISSAWDQATVYGNLKLDLQNLVTLKEVSVGGENGTSIQLPETSERNIETRIRIRPGDALIIGGIVQENDTFDKKGIGGMSPFLPTSRSVSARNSELVIMMRPHVVVYTDKPPENAILLKDGMYLQNPVENAPAVNVVSTQDKAETLRLTSTDDNFVPPAAALRPTPLPIQTAPVVLQQPVYTAPPVAPAPVPVAPPQAAGPTPLSPDQAQRLRERQKPVQVPSMSQYLNDLAPTQIAPTR
jgi:type II secretory pathway component GspD/PulD (secretin)